MTAAVEQDLTIRPITGREELDLFSRFPYQLNDEITADLDNGGRHFDWMWVALRGDHLLARAAWWSRPGDAEPLMLDLFDLADDLDGAERVEIGTRLLKTAMAEVVPGGARPPEYSRFLPSGWRDDPALRRDAEDRGAALEATGARLFVERLRLVWHPGTPIAPPAGRLAFRPVSGRDELVELMTRVLDGTLDAHSRDELTRVPPDRAAREQYDSELERYPSPKEWWRIATLPDGEPVGFVIPAHNSYNPIIAYIGVVPEHRGKGYIDEILAEGTRILAAQDVPRVRASTDVGNVPMAAAFHRAGYVTFEHELNYVWP
ncbi:GNAT family N-acetyltransferase [Sphaerisporangium fuscum]|uniref:GNAT family N-acetyltransferase n=1 Tax=Sphaerisporangium fuscum TaxID=2835868 RepID=UPI001BDD5290|nr:GNAT family N-acetyltransferase [Sphaerisporangium fuscum]